MTLSVPLSVTRFVISFVISLALLAGASAETVKDRTWKHQQDPLDQTTASFRKALEAALTLHQGYPANKAALAGKQGAATPCQTPVQFPTLARKYGSKLDWDGKVVQSCVHCHMVGDAFREHYRSQRQAVPAGWICPQPSKP